MSLTVEMKKIAEDVVFAYQSKISEVVTIVDNTSQILEDFKAKRNEMSNQLKEALAKEESLRRKDFDSMIEDILTCQDERIIEVKNLLKTFFEEQREIAEIIRKNLAGGQIKLNDFKKMLQDIQVKQKARESEVRITLQVFRKEYKEMVESLRSLLDKREAITIKDFKEMVKNIREKQTERVETGKERLFTSRKESKDVVSPWKELTEVMAKRSQ